ncbi:MAG: PspC domain-containing protein [Chloroflexi bacterium]|nr:PspC domain-containing protein [Chloroflexota bacterium]
MNNKTLYRTEDDKMIGGVCGGLGRYFEIDPTIVRLFFALIFFGYGAGGMIYLLLWIIMPDEKMLQAKEQEVNKTEESDPTPIEGEVLAKEE